MPISWILTWSGFWRFLKDVAHEVVDKPRMSAEPALPIWPHAFAKSASLSCRNGLQDLALLPFKCNPYLTVRFN